jgi:hypothetical protein
MMSIKLQRGVDSPHVAICKSKQTILCGICRDADAVTRWVVTEPLVEQTVTYVCGYCEGVHRRGVDRLVAFNSRLVVSTSAVA